MSEAFRCVFGPRLCRIYTDNGRQHQLYQPSMPERVGDKIINVASYMYSLSFVASPIIGYFMIKRGFFTMSGIFSLAHFGMTCFFILAGSYCIRGYGRLTNIQYRKFMKVLMEVQKPNHQHTARQNLAQYDFQFSSWPIDFYWNESEDSLDRKKFAKIYDRTKSSTSFIGRALSFPGRIARYIVAHYFARPLMYPGSVRLLQNIMSQALNDGRSSLVAKDGWRAKLQARDNNEIDTMFIDRRTSDNENGQILVIGCEGNAAFYEVGTIHTPLNAGYSVLGWNHPGFAGSSGLPYPDAEQNAIDVVIKYAMDRLGFPIENIVLFSWSIGGYSATWAAMMYPDIRGLILDATFDTITPLAVERMPEIMSSFTEEVVNDYFPLFNHEHLTRYSGPVLLYRRTKDEMISVNANDITTNRGNYLLIELLKSRYPNLESTFALQNLRIYLAAEDTLNKEAFKKTLDVDDDKCKNLLRKHQEENGRHFPCEIGNDFEDIDKAKMLIYLVSQYLIDIETTHCTALPAKKFRVPQIV
ncbi:protein ABHD16A-like [Dendronephthya gigantea]|uniref:protein ABHD16A-like n=1 Tax=Dendronephthya gigantea TaxID=151771 RepID=UPI00106DA1B8|nr:protein ABHD16A-like [Dendronephthya gigantea]